MLFYQISGGIDNQTSGSVIPPTGGGDNPPPPPFTYVLDGLSTAPVVAYSASRLLLSAYVGNPVMKIRRVSDDATLNIGAVNGLLDTASIASFCGASAGKQDTLYDQSGNARHFVQNTLASQPEIWDGTAIRNINANPAVYSDGNKKMSTAGFSAFNANTAITINFVAKINSNVSFNTILSKSVGNAPAPFDFYNSSFFNGDGAQASAFTVTNGLSAANGAGIWTLQLNATNKYTFFNGSDNGNSSGTFSFADGGTPLVLFSRADGATACNGYAAEIVLFDTVISTANRQILEQNQEAFYGITGI